MNLNYIDRNLSQILKQDHINLINSLFIRYAADFMIIHNQYVNRTLPEKLSQFCCIIWSSKLKQKMNLVVVLISSTIRANTIASLYLALFLPISIMRQLWLLNRNFTKALISGVFLNCKDKYFEVAYSSLFPSS